MNVLIVEDDFRIGEMYKEYLQENTRATHIESVINANQALEYLNSHPVDLILLDIYLPDMMGDSLLEHILKHYPYINFICISANQRSEIIKNLMNLGILHYLIKPVKLEKLKEIVNRFIEINEELSKDRDLTQEQIDELFIANRITEEDELPKGIDPVSLKKIKEAFHEQNEWSSSQLGEKLGTSRTTVRRYLEYLRTIDYLSVTQEFGDKGRPEKIYKK